MVDCGATANIVTDESKFVRYDHSFRKNNHFIELADGTRTNCVALKRGEAIVKLTDSTGRRLNATLKHFLFHHIPTIYFLSKQQLKMVPQ